MIEVKVGDYVECLDGEIGYVTNVECLKENEVKFEVKLLNYENNVLVNCNNSFVKIYFKRIGSHDFTVKENKIEPLKIEPKYEEKECMVANIKSTDYPNTPLEFKKSVEKFGSK